MVILLLVLLHLCIYIWHSICRIEKSTVFVSRMMHNGNSYTIFAFPDVAAMPIDPCKVVTSHACKIIPVYLFAEQCFLRFLYPTDAKSSWLNHFIEFKVPLDVERGL